MSSEIWHKVVRQGIDHVVDNPRIVELYRHWLVCRGQRRRAPMAQFHAGRWPDLDDRLMMLRREGADDFVYGHYGSEIARYSLVDMTGRRVSEFGGRLSTFFRDGYLDALQRDEPTYTVHFSEHSRVVFTWERLILPLEDDSGEDWLLVYGQPLEMRHELLETVLNATSDALLALRRLYDIEGREAGWLILVVNPQFAQMFEVGEETLVGRMVHEVLHDWPLLHVEEECANTLQSSRPRELTRVLTAVDGRLRYLNIRIGPLMDGVVLSLTDSTELHEAQNRLRHMATTDALTGMANRREFDEHLRLEVQRARRTGEPLALIMVDIDAFKAYNDLYGHAAGDDCLCQFALSLKSVFVRGVDLVARYGGEEFAVLLPGTGQEGALALADRLFGLMERLATPHGASPVAPHVTASLGVACFDRHKDADELSLLRRADQALYLAKQSGRARACSA